MNKRLLKHIALVISVCFITQVLPLPALAQAAQGRSRFPIAAGSTRNLRTKKNNDGTSTAVVSASLLQFLDKSGNWKDIDNSLAKSGNKRLPWVNAANRFGASFADKASEDAIMRFEYEGHYVEFGLEGSSSEKVTTSGAKAKFSGIRPKVDLTYSIVDEGVKEEIVLLDLSAPRSFVFAAKTDLLLEENPDGGISFIDSFGVPLWSITPSFMVDAAGATSTGCSYSIDDAGSGLTLTLSLDDAWLDSPERAYPVVVDPSITLVQDPAEGMDSYIADQAAYKTVNYGLGSELIVGNTYGGYSIGYYVTRALMKFDLASIPKGVVQEATLHLYRTYGGSSTPSPTPYTLLRAGSEWVESQVTWQVPKSGASWALPGGDLGEPVAEVMVDRQSSASTWYSIPVTSVVEDWVNRDIPNYGLVLKSKDEGSVQQTRDVRFASSEHTNPDLRPWLEVRYAQDITAPSVQIVSPPAGSTVSGAATVTVSAIDVLPNPTGVEKVELCVDGTPVASWTDPPYEYVWDTGLAGDGSHELSARAYDRAGNVGTSLQQLLLEDGFDDTTRVSNASTAHVDTEAGSVHLTNTSAVTQGVSTISCSSTWVPPSYAAQNAFDTNGVSTMWKSTGQASSIASVSLLTASYEKPNTLYFYPEDPTAGLQVKVDIYDGPGGPLYWSSSYVTLSATPTRVPLSMCTYSAHYTFTFANLPQDARTGLHHASIPWITACFEWYDDETGELRQTQVPLGVGSSSGDYTGTFQASYAADGNSSTAWVSGGKSSRSDVEHLDVALSAAPATVNSVYIRPRVPSTTVRIYTQDAQSAWVLQRTVDNIVEGYYSFPQVTTGAVRLEFTNLQGLGPYYAGVEEVKVLNNVYASPQIVQSVLGPELQESPDRVTLDVDQMVPGECAIDYAVCFDGTNWQSISPGVETVLEYPGSYPCLRATLSTSDPSTTPLLKMWRLTTPGEGVLVTVANSAADTVAPTVTLTEPAEDAVMMGPVALSATATDNTGVSQVRFFVDGELLETDTVAPYSAAWDAPSGSHQVRAEARDAAGNLSAAEKMLSILVFADSFDSSSGVDPGGTTASLDAAGGKVTLGSQSSPPPGDWAASLAAWKYRRRITVRNDSGTDLTDEPVEFSLTDPDIRAGGGDIRITTALGTRLPHTIAISSPTTDSYTILFTAPSIPAQSEAAFFVYYGSIVPSVVVTLGGREDSALQYAASQTLQSTATHLGSDAVEVVFHAEDYVPTGTGIAYAVSADDGLHWTNAQNGQPVTMGYPGRDLVLKATLTCTDPSVTPEIYSWGVEVPSATMLPDTSGRPWAPAALLAVAKTDSVDLSWQPSATPGAEYNVYRGTSSGFTVDLGHRVAEAVVDASWTDVTATTGYTYFYRVTAVTAAGESLPGNEASVTVGAVQEGVDRLGLEDFWGYAGLPVGADTAYLNVGNGNLVLPTTDLVRPVPAMALAVRRTYNSRDKADHGYGFGWSMNFDYRLGTDVDGNVTVHEGDGSSHLFTKNPDGSYTRPAGVFMSLVKDPDDSHTLTRKDGFIYDFDAAGKAVGISDRNGNEIAYTWTSVSGQERVSRLQAGTRTMSLAYDSSARLTEVVEGTTRVSYIYNGAGDLVVVTDPAGTDITYGYDSVHNLTSVQYKDLLDASMTYEADGRLLTHQSTGLATTRVTYAPSTRATTATFGDQGTRFEYDVEGFVTARVDPLGNETTYARDADMNVTGVTDPLDNQWTYTYDGNGNVLTAIDPATATWVWTYNGLDLPLTSTDPLSKTTAYTYDANGNLLTVSPPGAGTTTYTYDSDGLPLTEEDPLDRVYTYAYDDNGLRTSTTDPLGGVTQETYDSRGNLATVTDPLGRVIRYTYDGLDRVTEVRRPDGTSERYTYDGVGRTLTYSDPNGNTTRYSYGADWDKVTDALGGVTLYSCNPYGQLVSVKDATGAVSTRIYDRAGRMTASTDPLGNTTRYGYDAAGNNITVTDPNGHVVSATYNSRNLITSVTDPLNHTATFAYDLAGRRTGVTDPRNYTTGYAYDDAGRLTAVTDAANGVTSYEYDLAGNLTEVTDANNHSTTYQYDALNRQTRVTRPDGTYETRAYDAAGNTVSRTDPMGQETTYINDVMGRVTRVQYESGRSVNYIYDANGNRLSMRDWLGNSTWSYDKLNRPTVAIDHNDHVVTYSYDAVGRRTGVTTGSGTSAYSYDAAGRMLSVTDPLGGITEFSYDAEGQPATVVYPNEDSSGNVDVTTYQYDAAGNLLQVKSVHGSTTIFLRNYTYDANGNRSVGTTQYDSLNRLTTSGSTTYTYDAVGNRLTKKVGSASPTAYTYDQNNRLLTETAPDGKVTTYGYDLNGNQTSVLGLSGKSIYAYDAENRLTGVTYANGSKTEYGYNGDGLRVRMKDSSQEVYYQYEGSRVSADRDGAGAVIASYVTTPSGRLVNTTQNGGTFWYHFDALGSVVAMTDSIGTKVATYDYDEFGLLKTNQSQPWNNYKFTSATHDSTPGLYMMGARYYNPNTGRFLTQDTWSGNAYQPWTQHLYTYVGNNPLKYVDPTGHLPQEAMAIGLGIWSGLAASGGVAFSEFLLAMVGVGLPLVLVVVIGAAIANMGSRAPQISGSGEQEGIPSEGANSADGSTESGEKEPKEPSITYPGDDPTKAPEGFKWSGKGQPGGKTGNYTRQGSNSREYLRPDLDHPSPVGPHWDYRDALKNLWRLFPDNRMQRK